MSMDERIVSAGPLADDSRPATWLRGLRIVFNERLRYMNQILAIGLGGALGSMARFGMSTWVYGVFGRNFPYGTFVVNVLGCLTMGILFVLFTDRFSDSVILRAGILIGVLGGFTTFSSFSIEAFNLFDQGEAAKASLYVMGSFFLCISSTWLGVLIGRKV